MFITTFYDFINYLLKEVTTPLDVLGVVHLHP